MNGKTAQERMISPFEGGPVTVTRTAPDGAPEIAVTIDALTPEGAKLLDDLNAFCPTVLTGLYIWGVLRADITDIYLLAGGFITVMTLAVMLLIYLHGVLTVSTLAVFKPAAFRVYRGGAWTVYDRSLTHRFLMMKHDSAREERQSHELRIRRAQAQGRIISPRRYYDESFHIVFEYLGQRIDIATVYDQKRAMAIAARLKACDKLMDTKGLGDGEVMSPDEQWGELPGKLPGT
ncbi:MAG: hypothetical protein JAY90_11485 [Candidatus Thiodiazotropha lotti]|nr:hypothetical protein [Candidatus Thiodiazotropha lotti]